MTVDWLLAARDGVIVAFGSCCLIGGIFRFNPRLFLRHFPASLREQLPPKTAAEKRHSIVAASLLLVWILGTLSMSTSLAEARGTKDFISLALHCFLVAMVSNLADWLILDELWIGVLKPKWAVPAGIDPDSIPFERARHFQGFVRGSIGLAVLSTVIGLAVWAA